MPATTTLRYEVKYVTGEDNHGRTYSPNWVPIGQVLPADRPGSVTDTTHGRDVIVFTNHGDYSTVERSRLGYDTEFPAGLRSVVPVNGLQPLATLRAGQSYERDMVSEKGHQYRARWTHA